MIVRPIIAPIGLGDIVGGLIDPQTRKPIPSQTQTPTVSVTPSTSHLPVSPTVTPTLTASPTIAPTATSTATVTPVVTLTATMSGTPEISPTPSNTVTPTPTPATTPMKLLLNLSELIEGEVGVPYAGRLTSTGRTGNPVYSVWFSTLPPGITLSADGYFQGSPTEEGYFEVGLQVVDNNQLDPELFTFVIKAKRHN